MLLLDRPEPFEGLDTYRDEAEPDLYYVMPNQPRFRIDDNGRPVFKFLKYRTPRPLPGGKKGGGFLVFDVELTVPDDQIQRIKARLEEGLGRTVRIGTVNYYRGAANLQLFDSGGSGGGLVERLRLPAPSLVGKKITPVTVELSPEGATLAEKALQGQGGVVQVTYDLFTPVKLPPCEVTVWFSADKFMEFHQQVDIDFSACGDDSYRETLKERFTSLECGGIVIDPGTLREENQEDAKVLKAVRDWAWGSLEDAVRRMVFGDLAAVPAEDRKLPEDVENLWRDVTLQKVASFRRTFRQGQVMEWNPRPQGTLPNITTLVDKDGNPLKWEDFASNVDLDDPFFHTLDITLRANADFDNLPIHSVEVHLAYAQEQPVERSLERPDDIENVQFTVKDNNWKYKRWYEVNYKGSARTLKSPEVETDEQILTINVDDAGILRVDIVAGDINFNQVEKAQVTLQYEDQANGVEPIEQVFTLDRTHTSHRFLKAIFQPRRNPYKYKVKYIMADGKEFQGALLEGRAPQLAINDPFAATKTVSIRAAGNLDTDIDTIDVDLKYIDATNSYIQERSLRLSRAVPFIDWSFPVISETAGQIVYSGMIQFKDRTSQEIPETGTTRNTIRVGKEIADFLEVLVVPDLVDWTKVKLTKASLRYTDPPNGINELKDFILKRDTAAPTWRVELKDRTKTDYRWQATFFLNDNTRKDTPLVTTSEPSIILEVPA